MVYHTIVMEREGSIAIIKFNRPNVLNTLNRQVFLEMVSLLEEIQKEVLPKAVILTAAVIERLFREQISLRWRVCRALKRESLPP